MPAMLEREHQVAAIDAALDGLSAGAGTLLLFEGEHGIGRTRLLGAARERARQRRTAVLHARGSDLEQAFGFGVVRQLLETRVDGPPGGDHEIDAAKLLGSPMGSRAADDTAYETLHGLHRMCARLADARGLLISIDDLQWADTPSLCFVSYLASRLDDLAVVIVGAIATGEPASDAGLLSAITATPRARVMRASALSPQAVAEIVDGALGGDRGEDFGRSVHDASGGNPFLLTQLLADVAEREAADRTLVSARELLDVCPTPIARSVLRRVQPLAPQAVALAQAVSVLDPRTSTGIRHAAALADVDEAAAAQIAGRLVDAGVLRPDGSPAFVHPVVRRALYADIPSAWRACAHERAARLLAADGAPARDVAAHLLRAPAIADRWVIRTLREAAGAALTDGAPASAAELLARALEDSPVGGRADLRAQLGRAELRLNRIAAAADHLQQALQQCDGPDTRAAIGVDLARALVMSGRCRDAIDALDGLIEERRVAGQASEPRLEAERVAAGCLHRARRAGVGAAHAGPPRRALHGAPPAGASRIALAYDAFENAATGTSAGAACDLARRALADGRLLEMDGGESLHPYLAAWTLALCDQIDDAEQTLGAARASARRSGSRLALSAACCFSAGVLLRRGLLDDADAQSRTALEAARDGWRIGLPLAVAFRAAILLERDELQAATDLVDGVAGQSAIAGSTGARLLQFQRGRVRIATGELQQGLDELRGCVAPGAARHVRGLTAGAWQAEIAIALARMDRRGEAVSLAGEGVRRARAFGAASAVGTTWRAAGLVVEGDRAVRFMHRAITLLAGCPVRLELARAHVDLGAMLRRANRRAEARRELRHGLDLAERCAATALIKRAKNELQAAGTRPRLPLRKGIEALTASERRVAAMAAAGRTNRAIAQELFITVKTVEWHLGQAYRKLEVRSRRDLPAQLASTHVRAGAGVPEA